MGKNFEMCSFSWRRVLGLSAASVRLPVAPICKGDTVGLWRSGGNYRTLSTSKENRVYMVANRFATFCAGKTAIHLSCPRICWWRVGECSADEGPRVCLGDLLMAVTAMIASTSVSSLLGIPLWPGTHRRAIGPGQVPRNDLRR